MTKGFLFAILLAMAPAFLVRADALGGPAFTQRTIPESLGISVHFRGALNDGGWSVDDSQLSNYESRMDRIVELGIKVVRIDNAWRWTDKAAGKYDFQPHHRLIDALDKRGLQAVTILCFTDPRFETENGLRTEAGQKAYVQFCADIAREFKGRGIIWEMWNEPNLQAFWQPLPNAKEYMAAVKAAMIAMRKVDPECRIIAPSPCTLDLPFLQSCFADGLLDLVSAVSVHSYCDVPESMFSRYLHLRNLMSPKNIPIVCSEWGFSRVFVGSGTRIRSQEEQASLVTRAALVDLMSGLPLHVIYTNLDYSDKLEWNEDSFGLIASDGKPKKAFHAIRTLVDQLKETKFSRQITSGSSDLFESAAGDYVAEFSADGFKIIVAWTTGPSRSVKFEVKETPVAMCDINGDALPLPKHQDKYIHIMLTSDPVYLRVKEVP
jgi:hypothetical protein